MEQLQSHAEQQPRRQGAPLMSRVTRASWALEHMRTTCSQSLPCPPHGAHPCPAGPGTPGQARHREPRHQAWGERGLPADRWRSQQACSEMCPWQDPGASPFCSSTPPPGPMACFAFKYSSPDGICLFRALPSLEHFLLWSTSSSGAFLHLGALPSPEHFRARLLRTLACQQLLLSTRACSPSWSTCPHLPT